MRAARQRAVQQAHRVGDERRELRSEFDETGDHLVDVQRLTARLLDEHALRDRSLFQQGGETLGVEHVTGANPDAPRLVGIRRADALERGADLVVAANGLGDRVVRLMPREHEMGMARHAQVRARHATSFEGGDLGEQRRQVDDHAVGDHRDHVLVQDPARDQLQRVALAVDHHRVPGVVATLVPHHVGVLFGQQVDDLGFALIAPLGSDDDGDGHARSRLAHSMGDGT